ncbi:PAS domain S-box protein [Aphanothece hegewaldii]|nr:PAS domain S-box protein [Aphanothece hegewaldii]
MTENSRKNQDAITSTHNTATFSTARIFLVDEYADLQVYIKRLLSRQYDIEIVFNGIKALNAIAQQRPDLVIMSLRLSNLEELELIKQLRANPYTREIPIIVLSVLAGEDIQQKTLSVGADDYMIEPFGERELLARVEANLKITKMRQKAQEREQQLRFETEAVQQRISDILESITDAFVAVDHQWRYIYVNGQATRLLHKTREELLGNIVWEVFTEGVELNMLAYRELQRAMRERVGVKFEDYSPTLSTWFYVHAYPIPEGLAVYFQDITERKQIEATLRESQERLKSANERFELAATAVNCLIYDWDLEKDIVERTEGLTRILGYSPEEADTSAQWWFNICHPEDQARIQNRTNINWITQDRWTAEYRVRHKDGYYINVLDQGIIAKRDSQGNPIRIVGSTTDITDKKQAEQNYREQGLFLQNITNNVPVLLWTAQPDGILEFVSQPWIDYTGMDMEQVSQQGWQNLIHPDDLAETVKRWNKAAQTRQPYEMTHRLKRSDGTYHWCISRAVLTGDEQITPLRWVGSAVDIDRQKKAETALGESEERFRQMAETIEVVFWLSDAFEEKILYVSPAYERIWGRDREELYTDFNKLIETIYSEDQERVKAAATRDRLQEGLDIEYRIVRPDGSLRWIRDRSYLIQDADGKPYRLAGFAEDITDRKQTQQERQQTLQALVESEKALRQSLAILHTINEATPTLIYVKDRQGRIIMGNPALFRILGKPESEIIGYTDPEFYVNPADADVIVETDRQIMETGQMQIIEETLELPQGKSTFLSAKSPYYDESGKIIGLIGVSFDITDRKQTAQALQESEERLRVALEAARLGMWYWELESDTLTWTDQCKALFGLSTDTVMSYQVFLDALHPDDRQRTNEAVNQSIEEHMNYDIEYRTIWPDGTIHWIAAKGNCLYDSTGKPIRLLGVAIDITERKQTEENLYQTTQELRELNTELSTATTILEERNQELDQFVYVVSHDLKAPLRAISNLSQWIADDLGDQLPEENQQQMQLLQDRVSRMENLIDGLLNYSRINRIETAIETVNTQELLEEIIDSLAPPESFSILFKPELPIFKTARLPLSQVFANLISNAIKHHGRTDGEVSIWANDLGHFYQFAVADNGQGISPENHEKVFAIFQTLGSKESKNNTGIGLAIVKKLVEKNGGKITLESQLGQGTTFRFTWPKFR